MKGKIRVLILINPYFYYYYSMLHVGKIQTGTAWVLKEGERMGAKLG
jgi:hypothetical protein